jgi:hypothetical protein
MAKIGAIGYSKAMTTHDDAPRLHAAALPRTAVRASRIAAALATALLLWGTLAPQASVPGAGFAMADKLWHAVAFWGWACLVTCGWTRSVAFIMLAALGVGGLIECIQPLTGRQAEFADLAADLVGALLGIVTGRGLRAASLHRGSIGTGR